MFTNLFNEAAVLQRSIRPLLATSFSLIVIVGAFTILGQTGRGSIQVQDWNTELQKDLLELESIRASQDLDGLEVVINRESVKWQKRSHQFFVEYMLRACALLSSYKVGDQSKQALLLNKYAISVLTIGNLSLQQNVQFTEFLTEDPITIDETTWRRLRERKTRLWLEAWRRVAGSIDPNFNFDNLPSLNVPLPPSTGLPAGVEPGSIKDPAQRAAYEEAIAQNSAKIKRYNEQHWLKQNASGFFKTAESYLVNAYARPPADLAELERLLSEHVENEAVRKRVIEAVRQRVQQ
jgi:hypothetical protein